MYPEPELIAVGRTGKVHGVKGELELYLTVAPQLLVPGTSHLFIDVQGLPVPFAVQSLRPKGEVALLVKLVEVGTVEQARAYRNATVYLPATDLDGQETEFTWAHFIGFTLYDQHDTLVGTVTEVDDTTQNILFTLQTAAGKTLLVPVNEALIQDINPRQQTLTVLIPDGLYTL